MSGVYTGRWGQTYAVRVSCLNCGHRGTESVPFGKPRPDATRCPHCGCAAVVKPLPSWGRGPWR